MPSENAAYARRNAAILRHYQKGERQADVARRFNMTAGRVSEIITRSRRAETSRAALIAQYGERPNIGDLSDETPIEVLGLCRVKVHGWLVRLNNLKYADPTIRTLGDLRNITDRELLQIHNVGKQLETALRRCCPARLS